jgi:triphosphoribosyl-dephospho-CoA synthase
VFSVVNHGSPFSMTINKLPPSAAVTLACIYEATAPKPGNVHPGEPFDDVAYSDFVASAVVIGPIIEQARVLGVGRTVLEAVRATRDKVGANTNLGTLLLIVPLAAVPPEQSLSDGIGAILDTLDGDDTRLVYDAIRVSSAGGLGRAKEADVAADPPPGLTVVDAMRLAADRDLVARQYTNRFAEVFGGTAATIANCLARGWSLSDAIVCSHIAQMAADPDSLIQRKCGLAVADESCRRAAQVLSAGAPGEELYQQALLEFDAWLRADGHRRNPGTTADLVAAGLFVLLREGRLDWKEW